MLIFFRIPRMINQIRMTNDDVSFHPRTTDLAPRTNRANFTGLVLGCTSYGARPQARAVNLSLTINLAWKIFGNFSKIFKNFQLFFPIPIRYGTVRKGTLRCTVSDGIGRYRTVSYRIVPYRTGTLELPLWAEIWAVFGRNGRATARRCRAALPRGATAVAALSRWPR